MQVGAGRHAGLGAELTKRWEDLWQAQIGSQVVLVKVPPGWGRTRLLDQFQAQISGRENAPVTLTIRVNAADLPKGTGLQAQALRASLARAVRPRPDGKPGESLRAVELLGLDEPGGQVQLGLGIGGLFFSGLTAGISFLLAGVAAGAAQKAWDASPAGQDGALARTARAVATVSVQVPVAAIVDDADFLDIGLAVTLAENLTARQDSRVLLVAAVDPDSALAKALATQLRQGVTGGFVHAAEADPDMGYESRLHLARQLRPNLPDIGARRIAHRTTTFAEVFTVAAARSLADLGPGEDEAQVVAVVDAAAARLARPAPSPEATVLAWAGGLAHAQQMDRALEILAATRLDGEPDVRRWETLERLADPDSPRLVQQVAADLTTADRQAMAATFLSEALTLAQRPDISSIGKVAALRAAHHVRGYLPTPGQLPRAQAELVAALEALGDTAAASRAAIEALEEWPDPDQDRGVRDALAAAVIRLSHTIPHADHGPLAQRLITEAAAGGAATGLEARIWAANILLAMPGQRQAALDLARQAAAALDSQSDLGTAGDRWRLLLAYHAGRAGLPDLTAHLLAPLLASADPTRHGAAAIVQRAVDGPGADTRLQIILLEADLDTLPAEGDDDRLRIHHALAANYAALGDYRQALTHGQYELQLRTSLHGPRHPGIFTIRRNIAYWTGESGDAATALALYQQLLPDTVQLFGPRHSDTLATRAGIADWTGVSGDAATALTLYQQLLPDTVQALGPRHPDTLTTRANIAYWTGKSGHAATALALYQQLLPDTVQLFGPRHSDTLATRANIAEWTGMSGDAAAALTLYQQLLPDQEKVLGPHHPNTLAARANIADWIGVSGDAGEALRLYRDLLPDLEHILGRNHPRSLTARLTARALTRLAGEGEAPAGS